MVSFWPFRKREDNSPDSFERTLSQLASKIQTRNAKIAFLRQRLRKVKALWTLYTLFSWILFAFGMFFFKGLDNLEVLEYVALGGAPVVIYSVRKAFDYIFEYQITSAEKSLADLKIQQRETIEKLKEATKFYSTQSILEKYGDEPKPEPKKKPQQQQGQPGQQGAPKRLPGANPNPVQHTPEQMRQKMIQEQLRSQVAVAGLPGAPGERISGSPGPVGAPQAHPGFPAQLPPQLAALPNLPPPLITEEASEPRWYDRILDVLVGEDETSAKARYALICQNCRMVNGLAPPGTRDLDEVGQWGCARCGSMNGKERKPVLQEAVEEAVQSHTPQPESSSRSSSKKATRSSSRKSAAAKRPVTPEESTEDDGMTPGSADEDDVVMNSGEDGDILLVEEEEGDEKPKARRRKGAGKRKA